MSTSDDMRMRLDLSSLTQPSVRQRAAEERAAAPFVDRNGRKGLLRRMAKLRALRKAAHRTAARVGGSYYTRFAKYARYGAGAFAAAVADFVLDEENMQRIKDGTYGGLMNHLDSLAHGRAAVASREDLLRTINQEGRVNSQIRGFAQREYQRKFATLEGQRMLRRELPVDSEMELLAAAAMDKINKWIDSSDIKPRADDAMKALVGNDPRARK